MKEEKGAIITSGIPSLFLIFAVLVMVTLALLSYGTSRSDVRLSRNSIEQMEAFYKATAEAAERFNQLENEPPEEGSTVSFSVPFSDSQCIYVEAVLKGDHLTPTIWETRSIGTWEPDTIQHLYQGETMEDTNG